MIYIVAYMQLKQQLQLVLGKDTRCIVMDYSLEESNELTMQLDYVWAMHHVTGR